MPPEKKRRTRTPARPSHLEHLGALDDLIHALAAELSFLPRDKAITLIAKIMTRLMMAAARHERQAKPPPRAPAKPGPEPAGGDESHA